MDYIDSMYRLLEERHRCHPVLAQTGTDYPINAIVAMLQHALDKSKIRHVQDRQLELTDVDFTFNMAAVHQEGVELHFSVLGAAGSAGASHQTGDTHRIQITLAPESDDISQQPHSHFAEPATNEFIPALQELHDLLRRGSTAVTKATVDLTFTVDEDLKVRIVGAGEAGRTTTHGVKLTFKPGIL